MQFIKDKFQISAHYTPFAIHVNMNENETDDSFEFQIDHAEFEYWLDRKGKLTYDEKAYIDPKRGVIHKAERFDYHDFVRTANEKMYLNVYVIEFLEEEKTLI